MTERTLLTLTKIRVLPSPFTFTVLMILLNKIVNCPYTQDIGYLRKVIAEEFDTSIYEFILCANQKQYGPEDDEISIRDIGFATIFMIRKIQDERGDVHPKHLLFGNQEFFNMMFDLLSKDEEYDVENIWKLLMKLPQDEMPTAKKIEKLDIDSEEEWDELIDGSSLHKLLYALQIINKCQQPESEWQNSFLILRGYHHLFKTMLKLDPSKVTSTLSFKSVNNLCKLVSDSMNQNPDLMNHFKEHSTAAITQIMRLIHQVVKYSLIDLKKRGESYDDLYYRHKQTDQKSSEITEKINMLNQRFTEIGKFINLCFRLLYNFDAYSEEESISKISEYPELKQLLKTALFETDNFYIRDQFGDGLADILCNHNNELGKFVEFKTNVLNILLFEMGDVIEKHPTRSYKCNEIITKIIHMTPHSFLKKTDIDFSAVIDKNIKIIIEKETTERTTADYDAVMNGAIKIVRLILQQFPQLKEKYGEVLIAFLLKNCLFEVPKSNRSRLKVRPPKCKNTKTREEVFRLVNVLARDCLKNLQKVLTFINSLQAKSSWRTRKYHDWVISPLNDEKSVTGFVGIKNLGCICYMIALFQQLYMIPTFREHILAIDDPKKAESPPEDNLLYQLQCIFAFLNQSEHQYYNPQGFTNAFKDWDGNPTNVLIQMDVDEFFNMFMDKLEFAIKGTVQEKVIQEHFGGTYANEVICKGCPHYSERSEPYLAVNLQVKNKKSIKDSLDAVIDGEMLDGDNSYYCEKCDKKVAALKRTCIKRLPKHLILVLKRFEFDYDIMQKMKVNDYCEFSEEINMEPYTQEGLARREKEAKRAEKQEKDLDEEDETINEPKYPLDLYNYKLSGVLVHSGYAEGGHYYSFIKDREDEEGKDRWYEFNDEIVKEFDKKELESECFGGEEKWGDMMGGFFYNEKSEYYNKKDSFNMKTSEKHRNAYVLFYERISDEEIPYSDSDEETTEKKENEEKAESEDIHMASDKDENMLKDPTLKKRQTTIKIPDDISEMVVEENRKYWQYRFMFATEYSEFILEMCTLWNTRNIIPLNFDTRNRDYHILGINEEEYKKTLHEVAGMVPKIDCSVIKYPSALDSMYSDSNYKEDSDLKLKSKLLSEIQSSSGKSSPTEEHSKDSPNKETKKDPNKESKKKSNKDSVKEASMNDLVIEPPNSPGEEKNKSVWDNRTRYPNKNIKHFPELYILPNESMDLYKNTEERVIEIAEHEIFKLAATFYLTVKQRAYDKDFVPEFLDLIKSHLNKNTNACKWLITQFSNKQILAECLLQCPIPDMRKLVAGLLYC